MDEIVAKSKDRICASAAQQANGIAGDMMSAYWSAVEGKKVPSVFLAQAKEKIKLLNESLDALK